MRFPNAAKGINRIYTAEILSLLCGVGTAIISVVVGNKAMDALSDSTAAGVAIATGVIAVVAVVAGIMTLLGLRDASRDNESFKTAYTIALISLIVSIAAGLLQSFKADSKMLNDLAETLANVAETAVAFFVIKGIIDLSGKLGRNDMVENGNKVFTIYAIALIGGSLISLCLSLFAGKEMTVITAVVGLIVGVLAIVGYFAYLRYLGRAKAMLSE